MLPAVLLTRMTEEFEKWQHCLPDDAAAALALLAGGHPKTCVHQWAPQPVRIRDAYAAGQPGVLPNSESKESAKFNISCVMKCLLPDDCLVRVEQAGRIAV